MLMLKRALALELVLAVLVIALGVSVICTEIVHGDELDCYLRGYAKEDQSRAVKVVDRSGTRLYDGSYHEQAAVRRATFHLIGDRFGSVEGSALSSTADKEIRISALNGFQPTTEEISLTVDVWLQMDAYSLLADNDSRGAIIAMDYSTGEILTMTSFPSVDPLNPSDCEEGAFLNKAALLTVPGSVMKPIAVAAALEYDPDSVKNFSYTCTGENGHISCQSAHGVQNVQQILSHSCNCGIAALINEDLPKETLSDYISRARVTDGSLFPDYAVPDGSVLLDSDRWWAACGQAQDLVTPLNVASFYAAVANDGVLISPHLHTETTPDAYTIMSQDTDEYIREALRPVAESAGLNCTAFGKTGTAQTGAGEPHSWFVCSLTDEDAPPYTIAVYLEHGGNDGHAKRLAAEYINTYILGGE